MTDFHAAEPGRAACWRAVVLFGQNSASYKFALAQALLELAPARAGLVRLENLTPPFARRVCAHLRLADRQSTSAASRFLDACRAFNRGEADEDALHAATVRLGFANVLGAFQALFSPSWEDRERRSRGVPTSWPDGLRGWAVSRALTEPT